MPTFLGEKSACVHFSRKLLSECKIFGFYLFEKIEIKGKKRHSRGNSNDLNIIWQKEINDKKKIVLQYELAEMKTRFILENKGMREVKGHNFGFSPLIFPSLGHLHTYCLGG